MILHNIEFDGLDPRDYPDFADAYIVYAEDENGRPLTDDELEDIEIGDYYDELIQSLIP